MKIIESCFIFEDVVNGLKILKKIESIGRTCYKSEGQITQTSCLDFVRKIINNGHESVLEHQSVSVRVVCDRGVSHEIVRHRLASYSQESTRYCNYSSSKFGSELTFIRPTFFKIGTEAYDLWLDSMHNAETNYLQMVKIGCSPQEARSVLPNSTKTELVMTMNLREWRHFFKLRTAQTAHPQMREITLPMLRSFKLAIPVVFDDINLGG